MMSNEAKKEVQKTIDEVQEMFEKLREIDGTPELDSNEALYLISN